MAADGIAYLTLDDVVAIHDEVMERMGSPAASLRDPGLLESTLARPRNAAYYDDADLITQAGILIIGISQAQAFVEGNKRAAMQSGLMFLDRNGLTFTGDPVLLAVLIVEAAEAPSQHQAIATIVDWMRSHIEPLDAIP